MEKILIYCKAKGVYPKIQPTTICMIKLASHKNPVKAQQISGLNSAPLKIPVYSIVVSLSYRF